MDIDTLDIVKRYKVLLKNNGLENTADIQNYLPRKYLFYNRPCYLNPEISGKSAAIIGICKKVSKSRKNGLFMIKMRLIEEKTGIALFITWMGGVSYFQKVDDSLNKRVMVAGPIRYDNSPQYGEHYFMNTPDVFAVEDEINSALKIYPVYRKIKGIQEDKLKDIIHLYLQDKYIKDDVPAGLIKTHRLLSRKEALNALHNPVDAAMINKAKASIVYHNLYHYLYEIEQKSKESDYTDFVIKKISVLKKYVSSLPYELTDSQKNAINTAISVSRQHKRNHILLQGDVGSGKTAVAVCLALAMAENGFQTVIMAPTVILAQQHYKDILKAAESHDIKVCFLGSSNKSSERKIIAEKISEHEYDIIVGTQGVLSDDIEYPCLGMVITDEEHRFGVAQREKLTAKASKGVHIISMSATPIPRTLTQALYSSDIKVCELELPAVRKPVKTCIINDQQNLYRYILSMIKNNQQIYSVCPYVEEDENGEIISVEELYAEYKQIFRNHPEIHIAAVTGRMKPDEVDTILEDFRNNKYQILVSTTIIEVGVNVPNANFIIINNPDRFGLAQLHQLRGRVGRGSMQGYCAMYYKQGSDISDVSMERMRIMCSTTNGFVIAQEDLRLRGGGYLLGTKQSGTDVYLEMIGKYPHIFAAVKKDIAG